MSRKKKILENVGKQRRRNRMFTMLVVAALVAIIIGTVVYFATRPLPTAQFPFPCLGYEGNALHVHPWLRITIDGQQVTIPGNIGIVSNGLTTCFEPIHTHDTSGIMHIESPDPVTTYILDDFFKIWNATYQTVTFQGSQRPIIFNQTDILGFKNDPTHMVKLIVDGNQSGEYGSLKLNFLDYCDSSNGSVPPCSPTAPGDPFPSPYPYGTGHTILIQYQP